MSGNARPEQPGSSLVNMQDPVPGYMQADLALHMGEISEKWIPGILEGGTPRQLVYDYLDEIERIVFLAKAIVRGEVWAQQEDWPGPRFKAPDSL